MKKKKKKLYDKPEVRHALQVGDSEQLVQVQSHETHMYIFFLIFFLSFFLFLFFIQGSPLQWGDMNASSPPLFTHDRSRSTTPRFTRVHLLIRFKRGPLAASSHTHSGLLYVLVVFYI